MAEKECPFCGENMIAGQTKIQGEISGIRLILEGIVYECPTCHEKIYGTLSAKPLLPGNVNYPRLKSEACSLGVDQPQPGL